jgi:transketolase
MINSKELANLSRVSIMEMITASKAAHIGSSLSVVDILSVIYSYKLNYGRNNDVVLLSKGHAAAALYAVLGNSGFIPKDKLGTYCNDGSSLGGHVTHFGNNGVEFSTGSLGHALSFGVGKALAKMIDSDNSKVFVILSDGECDEGSIWEAALFAAHHKLSNLIVIIDRNNLQSLKSTEETVSLEPLDKKWESFGWQVGKIDGHNHDEILGKISSNFKRVSRPNLIIANTIKGKGISFMENEIEWHYKSPNLDQKNIALRELGKNN